MIAYPAFFFLISDPFASELVIDMPGLRDRHQSESPIVFTGLCSFTTLI
jgi:hypothetical protein